MNDDIRFILEQALHAPSGDNTQTLRWAVHGTALELLRESENDLISKISANRGFFVALGAMIENAVIAATARGYRLTPSYFPNPARPELVAVLILAKDASVAPDPLLNVLLERVTNRRVYERKPLLSDERALLLAAGGASGDFEFKLIEDRRSIDVLAKAASAYDQLIFSTKILHDNFFSLVNWTKCEDDRRHIGFYFPTLAAPPFTWSAMQLLRHWWIMKLGIAIKLHQLIALEQQHVYRRSGAYGIVLSRGDEPSDWVAAGRLVERLWLTATKAGLSVQPLTGTLFLERGIETEEGQRMFSPEQQSQIKKGYKNIMHVFDVEGKTPVFMFRLGHGKPPAARTSRRPFAQMVDFADSASDNEAAAHQG